MHTNVKREWTTTLAITSILLFFAVFLIYPLFVILKNALFSTGSWSLIPVQQLITSPLFWQELQRSALIASTTTGLSSLIGIPLAWLLTQTTFYGRHLWSRAVLIPLFIPPLVGALGIHAFFAHYALEAFWGIVLLNTLHLFPLIYVALAIPFAAGKAPHQEVARTLGAGHGYIFRTLIIPRSLPNYIVGAFIVFTLAYTNVGAARVLTHTPILPLHIFTALQHNPHSSLGAILVLISIGSIFLFFALVHALRTNTYSAPFMLGTPFAAPQAQHLTRTQTTIAYLFLGALTILTLLPHLATICYTYTTPLNTATLLQVSPAFPSIFTPPHIGGNLFKNILISAFSALVALTIGSTIALLLMQKRPEIKPIKILAILPLTIPATLLAAGYVGGFSSVLTHGILTPLYVIGYTLQFIPYVTMGIYASLKNRPDSLSEVAYTLGASPTQALWHIIAPSLLKTLFWGGLLVFTYTLFEQHIAAPQHASLLGIRRIVILLVGVSVLHYFNAKKHTKRDQKK